MAAGSNNVPDVTAQVMTVDEVAELLRVNRSTLYRLLKTGQIPGFRVGSDWRFNSKAIEEWRRAQEFKPALTRKPGRAADQPVPPSKLGHFAFKRPQARFDPK
jgi:excisionase family DNA binding protein